MRTNSSRANIARTARTALALVLPCALALTACSPTETESPNPEDSQPSETSSQDTVTGESDAGDRASISDANLPPHFDLQSHRGGRGEWTEESRTAFEESLAMGVTTLELDIVMSADGVPVVWHDPEIQAEKCRDTEPVEPEDGDFPYVGKLVQELSWEQLQTLECDVKLEDFPDQEPVAGNKLIDLPALFELASGDDDAYFNIETKIEAEERDKSAEPQEFVDAILAAADDAGTTDRLMIQSFDWRSLPLVREKNPDVPLVMLYDDTTWVPNSPWTGDVDYDSVGGDIVEAAQQIGAAVLSPGYSVPSDAEAGDDDYNPVATPEYIEKAHDAGLRVIPWTVNDEATMREQIEAGVDGIITDYPTMLKTILDEQSVDYSR